MATALRVQANRSAGFHVNRAKTILQENEDVTLEGIGLASTVTLKVANNLVNWGYATLKKIETGHLADRRSQKSTLTVTLQRTPDFHTKCEEFEKSKAEAALTSEKDKGKEEKAEAISSK